MEGKEKKLYIYIYEVAVSLAQSDFLAPELATTRCLAVLLAWFAVGMIAM